MALFVSMSQNSNFDVYDYFQNFAESSNNFPQNSPYLLSAAFVRCDHNLSGFNRTLRILYDHVHALYDFGQDLLKFAILVLKFGQAIQTNDATFLSLFD